jgi:hypothetical protein
MVEGSSYNGVDDQSAMADRMDLQEARNNCPSFRRFLEAVGDLAEKMIARSRLE